MPTPKIFKSFSSKGTPSEADPASDVPANEAKDASPQTLAVTTDSPIPEYSDSMKEAWTAAYREPPQAQGAEQLLNKIGQQTMVDTLAVPAKALMDKTQIVETIQKGVDTFMETVPILMKTLDEVAKIHPFISVAVLPFKAVCTLEKNRRGNDKRILILYVEYVVSDFDRGLHLTDSRMRDMMAVLVQLKGVSDPKQIAPDGQTIESRMKKLCEDVAVDIKKCANVCDTYLKKKLLVKIFASSVWDERLLAFTKVFTKRRKELEFTLTIRTTIGVNTANIKLDVVDERTAEITRKMDIMFQLFQDFVTPEQKKLTVVVNERGGVAALKDDGQAMEELVKAEPALITLSASDGRRGGDRSPNIVELQREIDGDPDEAIRKNTESFNDKFDIQTRQIEESIDRAARRVGDRVIDVVMAGPHDRIVDQDIYNIWKDMRWRGSVKGQHFVMSLKDYYIEKTAAESDPLKGRDGWATKYINIGRARSILEAFDDDASGFVTVNEVNKLTQSRPRDWSLPHWIAYWAIGWQMTCTAYCEKIEDIFDAMIRLAYDVLPENRKEVNAYIAMVWQVVTILVQSIKREKGTDELRSKFESHVAAEEAKLQRNFEGIKYDIDSYDTVRLIAGEGRLETTLFPMLYLALKRDLERISLARKHVLSVDELSDASETIDYIADAVQDRITNLRSIFKQQNLDAKNRFEVFADGLYNLSCVEDAVFHGDKLRELPDRTHKDEIIPDTDSIPLSILNHPLGKKHEIDFSAYDRPELTPPPTEGTDPVLGIYYGFIYRSGMPADPMVKFTFSKGEDENTFVAAGAHHKFTTMYDYKLTGKWSAPSDDGRIPVEVKIVYFTTWADVELTGVFDPEENSLRGTMFIPTYGGTGEFVFKRDPDFVRFYPAPSVINARKRWEFATMSVLDRIRRKAWSPARILKRLKDGKRYMDLVLRRNYYEDSLTAHETAEFYTLLPVLYEVDVRFYASLININLSKTPIFPMYCDNCDLSIGGSRIICMDCHNEFSTIDLCSEPECVNSTIKSKIAGIKPHTPNHGMFKIYRIIFDRDMGWIERNAKHWLDVARGIVSELEERKKPMPECIFCKMAISLPCWCCVGCTGTVGEDEFICDNCEYKGLAFNKTHTKMHTVVRVSEKVEEKELSVEERLRLVEDELAKIRQLFVGDELPKIRKLLAKLAENGEERSPGGPLKKGVLQVAAMEVESSQSEEEPGMDNA